MSLEIAHKILGWPEPRKVLTPPGAGASVLADLARQKLQRAIRRFPGCSTSRVGILTSDPGATATVAPIAVVVEYKRPPQSEVLRETHRLAWNFARSPLLITVDPVAIRSWSCCEPPTTKGELFGNAELDDARLDLQSSLSLGEQAAHALSWISLVSGEFFREPHRSRRFNRDKAADRMLLENLRHVRRQLHEGDANLGRPSLDYDTIHDLLARVMFMQFLADRRDADGRAALNAELLEQRQADGTLRGSYSEFAEVLESKADTYRLFRWLNHKFNGDLFPGKAERKSEEKHVDAKHLKFLAAFLRGDVELKGGQRLLWRHYSFDVIPLEFISSIYEEFVRRGDSGDSKGVVYTPSHLVDFILDGVLPWDEPDWRKTILDPACGSGIFLVKAYQRLIHRWKVAHPRKRPAASTLRKILENCLCGIDTEPGAVRVASFSLYLAMCDEIDPKRYWTSVRFPKLRGETIRRQDFFEDGPTLVDSQGLPRKFDLVVGNPPWGQEKDISEHVKRWVKNDGEKWPKEDRRFWPVSYKSIGPMFLPKAAAHAKPDGQVSLMQPTSMLLNDVSTARQFRKRLFSEFAVEEIVNLSPLRYTLFSRASKATAPPCIITFRPIPPQSNAETVYLCPKPIRTVEDQYRFIVSPYDSHFVRIKEITDETSVLTTLIWGARRDLALLKRFSQLPTLAGWNTDGRVQTIEGINRGDKKREQPQLLRRRMLESPDFPPNVFLTIIPEDVTENEDAFIHSRASTSLDAFESPQLIIKQSWTKANRRFRAAKIGSEHHDGILCIQSYVSIHAEVPNEDLLDRACVVYNSSFALYWLYMSNHWLASFMAKATVAHLLQLPLPDVPSNAIQEIRRFDFDSLDRCVRNALSLHDTEWALIEDFFTYTLADFKQLPDAPGSKPTNRSDGDEPELRRYAQFFLRVLTAAFGENESFSVTIFQEDGREKLPVRLVAVHFESIGSQPIRIEIVPTGSLVERLRGLGRVLRAGAPDAGGISFNRTYRAYDSFSHKRRSIPTLFLAKLDQGRYWTASAAMRDADEAFGEIMLWNSPKELNG